MIAHKRQLAEIYFERLPSWLALPRQRDDEFDVFHIFAVRHPARDALRQELLERGVKTEIHYPIAPHRQEAMRSLLNGDFPIADELHNTELSLPISAGHSQQDIARVCAVLASMAAEGVGA
jgi:dTDP-4-amino-4,6-dideoxygalactose transaminase